MSMEQVEDQIDITVVETDPSHLSRGYQSSAFQTDREKGDNEDHRCLFLAALQNKWEWAKSIIDKNPSKMINIHARLKGSDTVMHVAVTAKCTSFVKNLITYMNEKEMDMDIRNRHGDTGLSIAAASGTVEIAKLFMDMEKNHKLTMIRGIHGLIPLGMAVQGGHKEMAQYLWDLTDLKSLARNEYIRLFISSISSNLYDTALKLLVNDTTMANEREDKHQKTALHVLAQKAPDHVKSSKVGLKIADWFFSSYFKGFCSQASKPKSDRDKLLEKILEKLQLISIVEVSKLVSTPSGVLFDAAMSGNVELLAKFLRTFPGLIWEKDERRRSIFHIAIIYRQENVFNLIYNIGAVKDYLVEREDSDGNNMLHLAGMLPNHDQERLGAQRANLQMQRELLWFKEVGKIARPYQKFAKNKAGKTPREVFIATHKELLKEGERAIKGTASSCMLVATLIAAVVFNAALRVPGASNNEIPLSTPLFHKQQWSVIFILSNAVALFTSTSSVALLLSVLTSSYAEMEFEKSLHVRLMFGLTSLFVSITAMLLVFIAAMFLIFDFKLEWLPYLVVSLAWGPVALFLGLHFDLWADLIRSYYWSRFLFQPSEHRIFE